MSTQPLSPPFIEAGHGVGFRNRLVTTTTEFGDEHSTPLSKVFPVMSPPPSRDRRSFH
jgi:hypothetical protein